MRFYFRIKRTEEARIFAYLLPVSSFSIDPTGTGTEAYAKQQGDGKDRLAS
jgi:hypothetical protein